jgi:uncharacterized protein YchJ
MEHVKRETFTPNSGVTEAERYLYNLCSKTFLSLWSYPGLYKKRTKEFCDLLVVFDNNVIIFSDKFCKFPESDNLQENWNRWFNRAITKSAKQAWGAERYIKSKNNIIYSDNKASEIFPFSLPQENIKIHLIVVAHDGARRCAQEMGGSGSFMLQSDLQGINNHTQPFIIGDLDPNRTFVHILDDTSLNIMLTKLDTITDFLNYLTKKELLFRSSLKIMTAGEEELLAHYLQNINNENEHDFIFPNNANSITIPEGIWEYYVNSEQARNQRVADIISYAWDKLIEKTSYHTLTGTQYFTTSQTIQSSEKVLRLMAKESRTERRILSRALIDLLKNTKPDQQNTRFLGPLDNKINKTTYVFFLYPWKEGVSEKDYRKQRRTFLTAFCFVAKIRFPQAQDIVGIATETNIEDKNKSEDVLYLDASKWTQEDKKYADKIFKDLKLQKDVVMHYHHEKEYPDLVSNELIDHYFILPINPRNKTCPCGSGIKYKKCHGK